MLELSFVYLVGRNLLEWVSVVDGEFDLFWRSFGTEWWENERRLNLLDWFVFRFWCHSTHSVGRDLLVNKNIVKLKYMLKLFKFIRTVFVRMYLQVIWSEVLQLTVKHVLETGTHIHLPAIRTRNLLKKEEFLSWFDVYVELCCCIFVVENVNFRNFEYERLTCDRWWTKT